jgi:hypothetical protein
MKSAPLCPPIVWNGVQELFCPAGLEPRVLRNQAWATTHVWPSYCLKRGYSDLCNHFSIISGDLCCSPSEVSVKGAICIAV